jgi:geranylgeranyl pyrophosphate synthase
MLRTRLALRLAGAHPHAPDAPTIERLCAAVEMVHTASLCHDDVIDNALLRRSLPALWRDTGGTGAVLIGDLLLSDAMELMLETDDGRYAAAFVAKIREVCLAETEHELKLHGKPLDEATCLRLARGKTGSLFAFVAEACAGEDADVAPALEEAGYLIGTAYQLADDLLDATGEERLAGKTLGSDLARRKFTLAQSEGESRRTVRVHIQRLCGEALERVGSRPCIREALKRYLDEELQPLFDRYAGPLDNAVEMPT